MNTVAELTERLQELHRRTQDTPLFNPVFQLSLDLSRELESGRMSLEDMAALIAELECDALQSRARRLRRLVEPPGMGNAPDGWDAFRARWEQPQLHAVFTAHPTFLLTPAQSDAVAQAASRDADIDASVCVIDTGRPEVTLSYEHDRAMQAIANAQDARDRLVGEALGTAREHFGGDWLALEPLPLRFAVGVPSSVVPGTVYLIDRATRLG